MQELFVDSLVTANDHFWISSVVCVSLFSLPPSLCVVITSFTKKDPRAIFGSVGLSLCLLTKCYELDWDEILWRGPE